MDNTNYAQILSERILSLRKEKGLTQEALAGQLGVSFQAVSKWENGQSCPDIALLPLLADVFGVTVDSLFGKEPPVTEPPVPEPIVPEAPAPIYNIAPIAPQCGKRPMAMRLQGACLLVLACLLLASPLALLAGAGMARGGKTVFGYRLFNVLTASMEPAIGHGDLILVKYCTPEMVRPGDDITYYASQDALITHRLVEVLTQRDGEQGLWFVTKGVNNSDADPPFEASQLLGKVKMRLPKAGAVMGWMQEHSAVAILAMALLLLLSWPAAVLLIWLAVRRLRRK